MTPAPPELSLLTAARTPVDVPRWQLGLDSEPASCGRVRVYDPCTGDAVDLLDRPDVGGSADPFVIESWATCSTGTSARGVESTRQAALDNLELMTAYAVEHELWTGELAREAGAPNRALIGGGGTDADPQDAPVDLTPAAAATTGVSPLYALGALEKALGSFPGRGYLHTDLAGAAFLMGLTAREGTSPVLRTKLGSVLVPGVGYPGTGPDGTAPPAGTTWVYGTGPVTVRLTAPELVAEGSQAVDTATNTVEHRAARLGLATWDGCALFAVLMTLKSD